VYKLHVPEECKVILKSFSITSHFNIHISPAPLNVPWSLDPMKLPADLLEGAVLIDRKLNSLQFDLQNLLNETSQRTDFDNMLNKSLYDPFTYPWFIWVTAIIAIISLLLLIFWYIYNSIQSRKYQAAQAIQNIHPLNQPIQQHLNQQQQIVSAPPQEHKGLYPSPPYAL
jgi:cbb3-type cytochrome oxidase subunit 3